jgi:hypothetical protein
MSTKSIISQLDHELALRGFSRKGATWNRHNGSLVEVVDLQSSRHSSSVTMNAGVLCPQAHLVCWGRDAEPFVEEPFCTVRARIGQLMDNRDLWWSTNSESAADEIIDHLERIVLPFLERMQSLEEMGNWLAACGAPSRTAPLPSIYFAVIKALRGDPVGACTTLAALESEVLGAWKSRVGEVSARIGCEKVSGLQGSGAQIV